MFASKQVAELKPGNEAAGISANRGAHSALPNQSGILVVDDNLGVRQTLVLLLTMAGYKAISAQNGFEALQNIDKEAPALLLCDLDMPGMSGFELLTIVRRRFPKIAVIAMSGSYEEDAVPEGVVADTFYCKGRKKPIELFQIVAEAIDHAAWRMQCPTDAKLLIWARRIGTDIQGERVVLVTCTDCLRSFAVTVGNSDSGAVHEASCTFCKSRIQYVAEQYRTGGNCSDSLSFLVPHDESRTLSKQAGLSD